jgi:hypothetical protein
VDGPLAASTCQAGVLANHQEKGAGEVRQRGKMNEGAAKLGTAP